MTKPTPLEQNADRIDNLECGLKLQMERHGALTRQVQKLKDETAGWIDELQAEDARLATRLDALNKRITSETNLLGRDLNKVDTHLDALDKDVRLIAALCNAHVRDTHDALEERVEELERGLDAANQRTSKQHYALEKRHYALAERVEKLDRELAEVECVKLPDLWLRSDELEREVADHETRITHQAVDQVEFAGELADLKALAKETAERIDELQAEANVLADRLLALDMWRRAHHHTHNEEAAAELRLHQASERRIDALAKRVAELEQHIDITGAPKDSTEKRKGD